MEDVLAVYEQPVQPNRARICFDERTGPGCQLLDNVVIALPMKPGVTLKEDNDGVARSVCA